MSWHNWFFPFAAGLSASDADMRAFSASDAACYKWPEDTAEHKALRAAYIDGAASCSPANHRVGEYVAEYTMPTRAELDQPTGAEELIAASRPVSPGKLSERRNAFTAPSEEEIAQAINRARYPDDREPRELADEDRSSQAYAHRLAGAVLALLNRKSPVKGAALTDNELYYLRSIKRQLTEVREAMADTSGLSLGNMALADNLDWLDCFIDQHERATQLPSGLGEKDNG